MAIATNAVKATAKYALKNNWLKVIVAGIICIFTVNICTNCSALLSVLSDGGTGGYTITIMAYIFMTVFLILPILLGFVRYIWRILFSVCDEPISVFYWFSSRKLYIKALKFIIPIVFRVIMWLMIFSIPVLFLNLLSNSFIYETFDLSTPLWTADLSLIISFAKLLALLGTALMLLKYYMAPVLFVANEAMEADEALLMSAIISRKTSVDFIYLCFGFFHWIFLSFFGIPLIFTLPYMVAAYCVHVRFSVTEYNIHINRLAENDFYNPPFGV